MRTCRDSEQLCSSEHMTGKQSEPRAIVRWPGHPRKRGGLEAHAGTGGRRGERTRTGGGLFASCTRLCAKRLHHGHTFPAHRKTFFRTSVEFLAWKMRDPSLEGWRHMAGKRPVRRGQVPTGQPCLALRCWGPGRQLGVGAAGPGWALGVRGGTGKCWRPSVAQSWGNVRILLIHQQGWGAPGQGGGQWAQGQG